MRPKITTNKPLGRLHIAPSLAALLAALATILALALLRPSGVAASPPPPSPPLVVTGTSRVVTTTSVVLDARVDPHGLPTVYAIQYGPSTAYGSQTPSISAGDGTIGAKFSQLVSGLQPGTLYHYRVLASNSVGTTVGEDATFTTKPIKLTMTISAKPSSSIVFGEPLSVLGSLAGTGNAHVAVVLQANSFPYDRGFTDITSPTTTDAAGNFLFRLHRLSTSASLRVALVSGQAVRSNILVEHVKVRATLHIRPTGRPGVMSFYGLITPRQAHAHVLLQRLVLSHHRHRREYVLVSRAKPTRGPDGTSQFDRNAHLGPGVYRVLVRDFGAQISGLSGSVTVR
jgi:hypothetical protein